jgi:hypothetical protein
MRVARLKEASENSSAKIGARKATSIRPGTPLLASTRSLTTQSGALEAAPIGGFMYQSAEDIEDGGLNFTAVYKKGYEDE